MARSTQAGFTLVEITIVFAISGLLLLIAFVGQSALRGRTRFDASVDKMSATVAQARNEATAGVNIDGKGDGTTSPAGCNTSANIKNTFAGTVWTADNSTTPYAKFTVDYYVAQIDTSVDPLGKLTGVGCKYDSRALAYPGDMTVNITNGTPSKRGARILYVRTDTGGLVVCKITDLNVAVAPVAPSFGAGACVAPAVQVPVAPPWVLSLGDPDGRVSSMLIDPSGLARREN
jgi:prepilin-type N-terminal cleavage/methylation domain-containing protein